MKYILIIQRLLVKPSPTKQNTEMIEEFSTYILCCRFGNKFINHLNFRFEPAANGIPSSVFFPQSDPEERLTQCSASLQALLGELSTSSNIIHLLMSVGYLLKILVLQV